MVILLSKGSSAVKQKYLTGCKKNNKIPDMLVDLKLEPGITNTLLLDFYGQLLTRKAYEISDLHYNEDMSLSEIAEELGVTRQAVHDSVQRTFKTLQAYEDKLGLAGRFLDQRKTAADALSRLDSGDTEAAKQELLKLIETI